MAYITGLAQTTKTASGISVVTGVISVESKHGFLYLLNLVAYELLQPGI